MRKKLNVNLKEKSYQISIESGLLNNIGELIRKVHPCEKAVIITDENVDKKYSAIVETALIKHNYQVDIIILKPGESTKSLGTLPKIYNRLIDFELTRTDILIALGGGVIGDICGFVASSFMRGVPYVHVPTTLLAQVDSSVGGKVGVNLEGGKNLVGSFYQPKGVFIDPDVLYTLPDKFFTDGMAEVIKYGCIKDEKLFEMLYKMNGRHEIMESISDIIYRCCGIKRDLVENDERDMGDRMLLNFGHTIGHAIEKYYDYEMYTHGEAVAIGMYNITKISEDRGLTKAGTAEKLKKILADKGLPYDIDVDMKDLIEFIKRDKKNLGSKLKVVLLKEIGSGFLHESDSTFFEKESD
ncbi:MAG: 3-dehydroquinate synthase [Clostridioides sp.]|jgi:3-dehydroquinate synthase|nr:3-dehydroquinate synthase [Clostridioides sp.]